MLITNLLEWQFLGVCKLYYVYGCIILFLSFIYQIHDCI